MKSFHRTMGYLMGFFFLMTLLSVVVAISYIERNGLSIENIFTESTSINYTDHWDIDFFPGILSSNHRSNEYETISLNESQTFDFVDQLFISTAVEDVQFIEEDRDNILIEYSRDRPDTDRYHTKFNTQLKNNQLSVTTSLSVRNLIMTKHYEGTIKVHVPTDYHFEEIKLDSDTTRITNDNIYQNTDKLILITDLGDIDISINQDMDYLGVFCDLGSIDLHSTSPINNVEIRNNLGDINVTLEAMETLDIKADLGSIDAHLNLPSDTLIYADTDLGSIKSDFARIESPDESSYTFQSDLGSIQINQVK
jgi:hypothetical protein